ncbi:MAG: 2-oxo acid dehydrogenase subunit E2 [Steroidobacteraceae bacterium]
MPVPILMPALSPTMTEGKVVKWLKREGDPVRRGEVIAEVETDKAILEVEATEEGLLGEIIAQAGGAPVEVDQPIAILLGARDPTAVAGTTRRRILASPRARRLANQRGIDLAKLSGSGPLGRIECADVEKVVGESESAGRKTARPMPSPAERAIAGFTMAPHTASRKAIARRLVESKTTIPHFYLSLDCELDAVLSLRERLNRSAAGGRLSVNDFVIRAAALALREQPAVNASWTEEGVRHHEHVDIAVAVATPDGLVTPIVRDADLKSLTTIAGEMRELTARAREKRLLPEEFEGGGFTISNLGMYGIRQFAAIINPPQAAILAVGKAEPRAAVRGGALAVAVLMSCTLSCDHRVIDGAAAAKFLGSLRTILESPARIYP